MMNIKFPIGFLQQDFIVMAKIGLRTEYVAKTCQYVVQVL